MNINLKLVNMIPRISKQPSVVAALSGLRRMLNVCIVGSGVAGWSTARRLIKVIYFYVYVK